MLCPICDGYRTVLRPGLVRGQLERFVFLRPVKRLAGLPCPVCCTEESLNEARRRVQMEVDGMLSTAGVPKKFRSQTLDDFCDDEKVFVNAGLTEKEARLRKAWKAAVREYIDRLEENLDHGIGLSLFGSVGTGKTLLLCIVTQAIIQVRRAVIMIADTGLLEAVKATYEDDRLSEQVVLSRFRDAPVLAIDDYGTHRDTDWSAQVYHQIVDTRYDNDLPMLISSNRDEKKLRALYPRQMDRLARNVKVEMVGRSLRGTVLEGE